MSRWLSSNVARTYVPFTLTSKNGAETRRALADPRRVVAPASVLRPAVWLKMRSWSTRVWKTVLAKIIRTSGSNSCSTVRPASYEVAEANGVARSGVMKTGSIERIPRPALAEKETPDHGPRMREARGMVAVLEVEMNWS